MVDIAISFSQNLFWRSFDAILNAVQFHRFVI